VNGYLFRGVLLFGLLLTGYYAFIRRNRLPFHLVIILGMLGVGSVFVIEPELANLIAHGLGLWRGADLILYLMTVLLLFCVLYLAVTLSDVNRSVTEMVRTIAILEAELEDTRKTKRTDGAQGT
jgi:hypothetical protein